MNHLKRVCFVLRSRRVFDFPVTRYRKARSVQPVKSGKGLLLESAAWWR